MQEIRARVSWNPGVWVGYLTAAFAIGQIAGPVASAFLLAQPAFADNALRFGLMAAAATLFASSAWLWRQSSQSLVEKELTNVR